MWGGLKRKLGDAVSFAQSRAADNDPDSDHVKWEDCTLDNARCHSLMSTAWSEWCLCRGMLHWAAQESCEQLWQSTCPAKLHKSMELYSVISASASAMGVRIGKAEASLGLYYLAYLNRQRAMADPSFEVRRHSGMPPVPPARVALMRQYVNLAAMAYSNTEQELVSQLESQNWCLVIFEPQTTLQRPAYYIACHPGRKEVIVSVCGTKSLACLMTDCQVDFAPLWEDGPHAHCGMTNGAAYILQRHRALLTEVLVGAAGFSLIVTGHSLGAGTAALLSLLMNHEGIQCRCIGYATPPVMEMKHPKHGQDFITNVVFRDDAIPRASPTHVRALVRQIHGLPWGEMAEGSWLEECLAADLYGGAWIAGKVAASARTLMIKVAEENASEKCHEVELPEYGAPGLLVHLYPLSGDGDPDAQDGLVVEYGASVMAHDSHLLEIRPTGHMVADHCLDAKGPSYRTAINTLPYESNL